MRTRPEYAAHLSQARRALIAEARQQRDGWMRSARELREVGTIPGGSVAWAFAWHRRMMLALITANRKAR